MTCEEHDDTLKTRWHVTAMDSDCHDDTKDTVAREATMAGWCICLFTVVKKKSGFRFRGDRTAKKTRGDGNANQTAEPNRRSVNPVFG